MSKLNSPADLEGLRQEVLAGRDPNKVCITLCSGTACNATGSGKVAAAIHEEFEKQGLNGSVEFRKTGCHGFCEKGPNMVISPEEISYIQVAPKDVPEIISKTVKEKQVVERLLYKDPASGEKATHEFEIPFYKH
ncbi:MAG TPA: (2Fe-2S) ferredoxin domain-containing protein, partial [Gammaproteobacteria bacterium]|nr:(2Fe-2S) ferredoxin domain-containing protein [Gammaproteobacteria bacterium]